MLKKDNVSFWAERAKIKNDWEVTSNDPHLRELESDAINNILEKYSFADSTIIDLGCGTGYIEENASDNIKYNVWYGIDPTKEVIGLCKPKKHVHYIVGDIKDVYQLPKPDILFTVRALINVPNIIEVYKHIIQICKPSTELFFSEASIQGLAKINLARLFHDLDPIKESNFNTYIDENQLAEYFDIVEIKHFASGYYYGSRIINPLMNANVNYYNKINSVFKESPSFGEWGLHRLFHCKIK